MAKPDRPRIPLRETFDTVAERYDRVRPSYPPELFDDLAAFADLQPGSSVLEIGCGTGQATRFLAARGYSIVAVELGARLADIARRNLVGYPNAQVVVSSFEDWGLPSERFDAVVSATAFHWIDPEVRIAKAAEALRAGGTLAVIEASRRPVAGEPVLARFRHCFERWTSGPPPTFDRLTQDDSLTPAEIDESGRFGPVSVRRYASTHDYSTEEHHELALTFSSTLVLPEERQVGLLACLDEVVDTQLGGRFTDSTVIRLVSARLL